MSRPFTPVPKPEPRAKKPKTKIKPVSTKQAKALTEYSKVRKAFLAEHLYCEANLTGCLIVAQDVHHKFSGSKRAAHFLEVSTWMAVCRVCHNNIHNNPKNAKELGYLL
jgi:5-methylcytosine-specific restriction endonuclease McrA